MGVQTQHALPRVAFSLKVFCSYRLLLWVRLHPAWESLVYRRQNSSRENLGTATLNSLPKKQDFPQQNGIGV